MIFIQNVLRIIFPMYLVIFQLLVITLILFSRSIIPRPSTTLSEYVLRTFTRYEAPVNGTKSSSVPIFWIIAKLPYIHQVATNYKARDNGTSVCSLCVNACLISRIWIRLLCKCFAETIMMIQKVAINRQCINKLRCIHD